MMNLRGVSIIGKATFRGYKLSRRAWKSPSILRELQNQALQKAVSIAYNQTDFYRERYKKHGVHPRDILTIEDLPKLPIITKQDLVENSDAAVPRSLDKKKALLMRTSGSTGKPVQIYNDDIGLAHLFAYGFRLLKLHKLGIPKAAFIWDINSPYSIESKVQGYIDFFTHNALFINVEDDIVRIMERLEKIDISYIATYTGIMRELATLKKNGMGKNIRLKKVGLTGEMLDEYTREYIEEAFLCPCYSSYISTEGGTVAVECENKKMHINSDSVYVEIVDKDGIPLPPGEDGNIVLTCYDGGYGTPIIRYSGCSDVGQLLPGECSCGMNTPIMGPVKGRSVDSIHLPDGRIYHAFSMTIPMEKIQRDYSNGYIRQYQIVQHELDQITISLVRNKEKKRSNGSLANIMEVIESTYQEQFGPRVKLTVQEVTALEKGGNAAVPTPLVVSLIGQGMAREGGKALIEAC